jgi:large subunit ribosomal protein L28
MGFSARESVMAKRCPITQRGVQAGNNVSHAQNKTRRRFLPNLQHTSVFSEALGEQVRLRVTPRGIRTIEHNGGLDAYLLGVADSKLSAEARRLKRRIEKARARAEARAG